MGIDFDPQGNLSSGIGIEKESIKNSVYDLLINGVDFYSVLQETEIKNLDVLPTNVNLAGAEIELQDEANRDTKLKEKIEAIRANYDFIIVDCPPSLSLLTINALTAADSVLIPIQCEYYALEGLGQMVKTINLIRKKLNKKLTIEGVVFTMYDARTNLSQQVVESVKETLDEYIYNAVIPRNVRLAEAPSYGKPITEYDTRSSGAESYRMLAAEVISRN